MLGTYLTVPERLVLTISVPIFIGMFANNLSGNTFTVIVRPEGRISVPASPESIPENYFPVTK